MTGPVNNTSPQDVVLALVRAVSGEIPLNVARARLLDKRVCLHMDTATYRGPASWVIWVQLLRAWGRLCPLRLAPSELRSVPGEPELVDLALRWYGIDRWRNRPIAALDVCHVRYRVRHGRIVDIWTSRGNYVFVLGEWVRYPMMYVLFKMLAILQCVMFQIWTGVMSRFRAAH